MTERTLARAIVNHRIDTVSDFVNKSRLQYGDEFVDRAIGYIAAIVNECEQTVVIKFTKREVEMIVAALYMKNFNVLADKIVRNYERK